MIDNSESNISNEAIHELLADVQEKYNTVIKDFYNDHPSILLKYDENEPLQRLPKAITNEAVLQVIHSNAFLQDTLMEKYGDEIKGSIGHVSPLMGKIKYYYFKKEK